MATIIHLVDEDISFQKATARLLHSVGFEVATYNTGRELLEKLPDLSDVNCILLDVKLPGLTGLELHARLIALGYEMPVIFVTAHGDIPTSVQAIKAGAEDFLTKPVSSDALFRAITRALTRHRLALAEKARLKGLNDQIASLTPRERQVFELVVTGHPNKEIAYRLGATERTIKAHRSNVMEKVQAASLAELVLIAERVGVVSESFANVGRITMSESTRDEQME